MAEYVRIAKLAGKVWRDHGALEYVECAGEDLFVKKVKLFPKAARMKPGEMNPKAMPFDVKRMVYGGFKTLVEM